MAYSGASQRPARRTAAQMEHAQRQEYQAERQAVTEERTAQLEDWVTMLGSVLARGLTRTARIDLSARRKRRAAPVLDVGPDTIPIPAPDWAAYAPTPPGPISTALGGDRRYDRRLASAHARF